MIPMEDDGEELGGFEDWGGQDGDLPEPPEEGDQDGDDLGQEPPEPPEDGDPAGGDEGQEPPAKPDVANELATLRALMAAQAAELAALRNRPTPPPMPPPQAVPQAPAMPTDDDFVVGPAAAVERAFNALINKKMMQAQAQREMESVHSANAMAMAKQAAEAAALSLVPELRFSGSPENTRYHQIMFSKPEAERLRPEMPGIVAAQIMKEKHEAQLKAAQAEAGRRAAVRRGAMHPSGKGAQGVRHQEGVKLSPQDEKMLRASGITTEAGKKAFLEARAAVAGRNK